MVAQCASSASNVVLSLLVLTVATRAEFATFALCLMSYLLAAQLFRSFVCLPILILYSSRADDTVDRADSARSAVGLAVAASASVSVVTAAAAVVWPPGRGPLFVLALSLPFLIYQDAVRHVAFARGDARAAAASDLLWLGLQVIASVIALSTGRPTPTLLFALWAISGASSACIFGRKLGATPRLRAQHLAGWLREHRALCAGLLFEFIVISGSSYAVYYGLSILSGSDELGRLRAAHTFIGPVAVALLGGAALGVPESVRLRANSRALQGFAVRLAVGLAGVAAMAGSMAYWVLPSLGPRFFPHTWSGARPVVPVLTLFSVALAITIGAVSPLRALGQVPWIVRTRALTGCLAVGIGLPAAALFDARGAVGALAVSEFLFASLAWRRFRRCLDNPVASDAGAEKLAAEAEAAGWNAEL